MVVAGSRLAFFAKVGIIAVLDSKIIGMHDDRWAKVLAHLKQNYEVIEHKGPEVTPEDEGVLKEVVELRGKKGRTRFERYTRVAEVEDPLDTSRADDWLFSEKAITSYIRGYRFNQTTQEWEEFDVRDMFFKL